MPSVTDMISGLDLSKGWLGAAYHTRPHVLCERWLQLRPLLCPSKVLRLEAWPCESAHRAGSIAQ